MRLAELLPGLAPAVNALPDLWLAQAIKAQFSAWEALHLVSMSVLGGASIILNLRLIGVGMTNEPASEIQRNLRVWINVGVIGILITGLLIALPDARRLYNSTAFPVKMLALLAGVILTYGVSLPVARADGDMPAPARGWWLAGLAATALVLFFFATTSGLNPGLFHLLAAAALIVLFAIHGRMRWIYLAGLLALFGLHFAATHVLIDPYDFARGDPTNKAFAWVYAAWILGFAGRGLFGARPGAANRPLVQAVGYVTILVWVLAAAAGRWIAFA